MPVFTPPVSDRTPTLAEDYVYIEPGGEDLTRLGVRLFSHFKQRAQGHNVWKKTDGTYTETQPLPSEIALTYLGGHSHPVTDAEAAALTAAGYGDHIE